MNDKNLFPLLTIKQAAELMGSVSPKTIRREIKIGRIRAVRARPGRNAALLIPYCELVRWVEEDAAQRVFIPTNADISGSTGERPNTPTPLKLVRTNIEKTE